MLSAPFIFLNVCGFLLAPRAGLEPATLRLTAGCSAIELPRNMACGRRITRGCLTAARSEPSQLLIVAKSRHSTQPSRQNRHMKYGIALLFATFGIIAAAQEEKP